MIKRILITLFISLSLQTPQDRGIVQGTITRSGTGDPIAGAQVRLTDPAVLQSLVDSFSSQGIAIALPPLGIADDAYMQRLMDIAASRGIPANTPAFQAALKSYHAGNNTKLLGVSDSSGQFIIRDVSPGTYTVTVEREGYFGGTVNSSSKITATSSAVVTPGRTTAVAISMIAGATISGRVLNEGVPQVGATVQAFSVNYHNGYQVLQPAVSKTTDDRGDYRLFFLPPGEYLVAASSRQAGRMTLSGTGPPAANSANQLARTFYPNTIDGAEALPLRVRGSEEIPRIDISIRTEKTFKVSGRIVSYIPREALRDQATPLRTGAVSDLVSAEVAFALHDPDSPDDLGGRTIGMVQLSPSGSAFIGEFEVGGVLPGSYDWRASVQEIPADGVLQPSTAINPIEVRSTDVSGLVLEIYPTVPVTGTVTIDGNPPGSTPVRVWLQVEGASAKRPGYQQIASRIATANAQDGKFSIPGIQTGRFRLMPGAGLPPDLYIEDIRQSGQSVFDVGFVVGREAPPPLQVLLRSGAATIEGTVYDTSKKPVSGATVGLIPPVSSRGNRARYQTAISDATGHFLIRNVIPGEYQIFAWPDIPDGAYFNARFLSRYEDRARTVQVGRTSTTTVDVIALSD